MVIVADLVSLIIVLLLQRSESQSKYQLYHQDVALVKTYRQLPIEYIIPLPDRNEDFTGQTCTISGWGTINGKYFSVNMGILIWYAGKHE